MQGCGHFNFRIFNSVPPPPHHQFRLKDGVRRVPHYGLLLARVAGLPASVIDPKRTRGRITNHHPYVGLLISIDLHSVVHHQIHELIKSTKRANDNAVRIQLDWQN